jgi:uncharacterized protein (DUF488 family)
MKIWDIGHSNLKEEIFLSLIQKHQIERIIDVRRFPTSKKFPHFERSHLEESLKKEGIDYFWLGKTLGGFRKGGYEGWMKTEDFQRGMEELEEKASKKRTAVMCAEKDFRGCHRRFIIGTLEKKGWKVLHISLKGKSQLF